ncbi:MAG: RNA methyltransferase [Paludibacteraceae bacterium]|nr:RNA methyltransferase [Paludibacteraceae bacterium]
MEPLLGHISKNQVRFIRSLQQKKVRDEEKLFVAEGDKCIGELMGHFELVTLIQNGAERMSSLKNPQGSLAVFRQRSLKNDNLSAEAGLILALDGIQDPGNLGTIIRTADWFGVTDIYCSKDTADCYNPKVVQATMGALARVNIHYVDLVESLKLIVERSSKVDSLKFPIYGTLLDGRNIYEDGAIADTAGGIIIMGNEGNGISAEVREFITHPLYIPSYAPNAHIESLNVAVATAITLAEFRRQFTTK